GDVLAADVEAEGSEPSDDELVDFLREARPDLDEKKLRKDLERLEKEGRLTVIREDVAMRKAVDLVVEHAKPIEPERAAAREKIWTPSGASLLRPLCDLDSIRIDPAKEREA